MSDVNLFGGPGAELLVGLLAISMFLMIPVPLLIVTIGWFVDIPVALRRSVKWLIIGGAVLLASVCASLALGMFD